jgi:hypothetical protein
MGKGESMSDTEKEIDELQRKLAVKAGSVRHWYSTTTLRGAFDTGSAYHCERPRSFDTWHRYHHHGQCARGDAISTTELSSFSFFPPKRTYQLGLVTSAFDQKRTLLLGGSLVVMVKSALTSESSSAIADRHRH